jgi:hypothetical protein
MAATMTEFLSGWIGRINQVEKHAKLNTVRDGVPLYRIGSKNYEQKPVQIRHRFGQQHEITRYLMTDKGVNLAIQEYHQRGGADMLGGDAYHYVPERLSLIDFARKLVSDKWGGAFMDGYRVEIKTLSGNSGAQRVIEVSVSGLPVVVKPEKGCDQANQSEQDYGSLIEKDVCFFWVEEIFMEGRDCCQTIMKSGKSIQADPLIVTKTR